MITVYGVGSRAHARRRDRSKLPLTPIQTEALGALSDVPAGPSVLSDRCALSAKQMRGALLFLSAKGLAVRTSEGWRRA